MLTNRSHQAPVILRLEVSTNGREWHPFLPAASGRFDNPTTESYMVNLLRGEAERQGYRYIRCLEQIGSGGAPAVRWDTSSLVDDEPAEPELPGDAGGFAPFRRRRA